MSCKKDFERIYFRFAIWISLVLNCFYAGCSREDFCSGHYETGEAFVMDSGDPAKGGCGWLIQVNDSIFYPLNLEERFKADLQPVKIGYENTNQIHQCGTGGGYYSAITIFCIKRLEIKNEVYFLSESQMDNVAMNMFRLHSARVDGDSLRLFVSFGGGCRVHQFRIWKLPENSNESLKTELLLAHDANGDGCQALIWKNLAFSLIPLRIRADREVTFLLRGSPEMSGYFGQYVYKY
jgi:hypothetical protein